jgi:hypothetical protein
MFKTDYLKTRGDSMPTHPVQPGFSRGVPFQPLQSAPPTASSSSAATVAVQTSALERGGLDAPSFKKGGRLADLDIHAHLRQYTDENYQKIHPGNPAYFFRHIRKGILKENSEIRASLLDLSNHLDEIEGLCSHIDKGEWETIPPTQRNKDAIFYAYAANRISREEFKMQHRAWHVQEQYQGKKDSIYTGKALGQQMTLRLPQRLEPCDLFKLFDETGELTGDGEEYLDQFVENLKALHQAYDFKFDESKCFNELKKAFKEIPENLQRVYCIKNSFTEEQKEQMRAVTKAAQSGYAIRGNAHILSQQQMTAVQMPWAAAPNKEGINDYFYSPSPAVFMKFLKSLNPDFVQPAPTLGSTGDDTVADAKLKGFNPTRMCEERAKSTYLTPHNYPMGVLDGEMHDEFHCMLASFHSLAQRKLSCKTFPDAIKAVIEPKNSEDESFMANFPEEVKNKLVQFGKTMNAHLIDISSLGTVRAPGPYFLRNAFETAFKRHLPAEDKNPAMLAACYSLVKRCAEKAKQSRTGNVAAPTLAHLYDWSEFDRIPSLAQTTLEGWQEYLRHSMPGNQG